MYPKSNTIRQRIKKNMIKMLDFEQSIIRLDFDVEFKKKH